MNFEASMRRLFMFLAAVGMVSFSSLAQGQAPVKSDPAGFITTSCLSNSDTFVSLPFTRPPEFVGAIQSAAGNVITVGNNPGWTVNQFVYGGSQHNRYYALIGGGGPSNPKEGHSYLVTANTANTLTVNTATDNLNGITANTQLVLLPYWTLGTVFPAADANVSFTPTASTASYKTQILVPNDSAAGINLPFLPAYFYSNNVNGTANVGWRVVGDNNTDHGDDILLPDSYFVVRHANGAPTLPFKSIGAVLTKKLAVPLTTSATQAQDNPVAMIRPVDVTLNATGLNPADGSFVATPPTRHLKNQFFTPKDQLLLFDNTQVAMNKSPSAIYYYFGASGKAGGWKLAGDGLADHGNDMIPAGSAIVIRKARTATGQIAFWTNTPNY